MDKKSVIQEVKALLLAGNTEKALKVLTSYLEKEGQHTLDLYNDVIQLSSQYEKTEKSEALGTVSFADAKISYNQINSGILLILKNLEAPATTPKMAKKRMGWMIGLLSAGVLGLTLFLLWPKTDHTDNDCPIFQPSTAFKILILPFKPVDRDRNPTETHNLLEIGLTSLIEKYKLDGKAKVDSYASTFALSDKYPNGNQEASEISEGCDAQLVIWGTTENKSNNEGFILTTYYNFLNESSIKVNKQAIGVDTEMSSSGVEMDFPRSGKQEVTLASFSSITQNIPPPITSRLKFLLGVFAHESGDDMAAQEILKEWPEEPLDSATTRTWGTLLADSYLKTKNTEKAEATYSRILRDDPKNELARNNRALLYYEKGKYSEAIRDLDANLEKNEKDTASLVARSYIYLKWGRPGKAEKDLERVRVLDPNRPIIKKWSEEIKAEQKKEEKTIKEADNTLSRQPNDVHALVTKARAERNLGNYTQAQNTAEKIIAIDPDNAEAHAVAIESVKEENKTRDIRPFVRRALTNGIVLDTLISKSKILENIIKKE